MALIVYTNNYSITAQKNLTFANNSLSQSIERLSSGLRINHASDDASGLAISEKLRGQIRGMSKASMNAQDAISFLQTAEGGMEIISDMLQRMRELAVQAGNGTYTANDRRELEKEVDQLKEEIDRISASTEFNTRKILTGQAAGLWSSDSDNIDAIIKSAPAEGNYRLSFEVAQGTNAVYKTDIMGVAHDLVVEHYGGNSTSMRNFTGSDAVTAFDQTTLTFTSGPAVGNVVGATTLEGTYQRGTPATDYNLATNLSAVVTSNNGISGYLQVEFLSTTSDTSHGTPGNIRLTFVESGTGAIIEKTVMMPGLSATSTQHITFSNGVEVDFTMQTGAADRKINAGDKMLFSVQGAIDTSSWQATDAAVQMEMRASTAVLTTNVSGYDGSPVIKGPVVRVINGQIQGSNLTGVTIQGGEFKIATTRWDVNHSFTAFQSGVVTLDAFKKGEVAAGNVHLKDIGLFTNADNRMVLDNTQSIDIYGNDRMATITMEGNDTINDLVDKLANAVGNTLGMAAGVERSNLVTYVGRTQSASGERAVPGTIILQGALTGRQSQLKFVGDEGVLAALSLAKIQEERGSDVTVTVTNAHTGAQIGRDTISDYMLRNVIQGVDVRISPVIGTSARYDEAVQEMRFDPVIPDDVFLHIVDKSTEVQVGANEGQTFDVTIGRMDTVALEITDAYVMTMADSQKAITKFDQALEKVNHARATIGAQINRLEYTQKNLSISRQNLIAAESRIRDLDVAEESATFARNQILVNAAVAMLAQANQLPQTALQLIGR